MFIESNKILNKLFYLVRNMSKKSDFMIIIKSLIRNRIFYNIAKLLLYYTCQFTFIFYLVTTLNIL